MRLAREGAVLKDSFVSTARKPLAGYLVGVQYGGLSMAEAQEHLDELEQLTETYGIPVVGKEVATVRTPTSTYFVGSGKVQQIATASAAREADIIIFDDDLTPSQQRNWERLSEMAVIDRREVILGIFADRAHTKEARLQVDLARAEYSLPRLTRAWTHLERQRGGGGLRGGAGEAQLEVDRRLVRQKIVRLRKELQHVRRVRSTQRKSRVRIPIPTAVLVGYTNAGKSSLLNALTHAGVVEADKLFATLDPTTRKLELPNGQMVLLSDTVGFIRKLPHTLVEAFKATLEEAQLASMLIHVIDTQHPQALIHRQATEAVLEELGALCKPTIIALNKVDLLPDRLHLEPLRSGYEHVVETSTATREGLDRLAEIIAQVADHQLCHLRLRIPPSRYDLIALVHREGQVESMEHDEDHTVMDATVPRKFHAKLAAFVVEDQD